MDYEKLYNALIEFRKQMGRPEGYIEVHHIIPKSFGGGNDQANLIAMTAREHFVAHRLLAKIYPDSGMVHAVYKMVCANQVTKRYKVTSRVYEHLRIAHATRVSNDKVAAAKKSLACKGRKQSREHIKARTESRKRNGQWLSDETKRKISESNTGKIGSWAGKTMPAEYVAKRNETRKRNGGYEWSEERKKAQSERLRNNPVKRRPLTDEEVARLREEKTRKIKCPHCGKEGMMLVMPRWHFDNCKFKS